MSESSVSAKIFRILIKAELYNFNVVFCPILIKLGGCKSDIYQIIKKSIVITAGSQYPYNWK